MTLRILPIVEGHGETHAVDKFLAKLGRFLGFTIHCEKPIRVHAQKFIDDEEEFGRYVRLALDKAHSKRSLVLVLLDLDEGCIKHSAELFQDRLRQFRQDVTVVVAFVQPEFEIWFLYAHASIAGHRALELKATYQVPADLRDAKGEVSRLFKIRYTPTMHQREFVAQMDIGEAAREPCLARLGEKLKRAAGDITSPDATGPAENWSLRRDSNP
ncbi:MAG: DUF4276 family protein [Fimbriimonadaceae bacterium]|nr:DUF4276 family protein [Fimbriimonadaceae bacterium]